MKQLKDLELINNTKNLQQNTNLHSNNNSNNNNNNNLKHTTIKTYNSSHNSKLKVQEPVLEIQQQQQELQSPCTITNNNNNNNTNDHNNMICLINNHNANNTTKKPATPKCENLKDFHSLPPDLLTERFIGTTHNYTHEYRGGKVEKEKIKEIKEIKIRITLFFYLIQRLTIRTLTQLCHQHRLQSAHSRLQMA